MTRASGILSPAAGEHRRFGLRELSCTYLGDSLVAGYQAGTVAYRRVYLAQFAAWLRRRRVHDVRDVTPRVLGDYLVRLTTKRSAYGSSAPRRLSGRTLAAEVSVLRSFFRWLTARRILLFDPAEGLRFRDRASALPKTILSESEIEALMSVPGTDTLSLRDRAILETLYSTGLRRAELCALDLYDLDTNDRIVRVRNGKGGRDRIVPIGRCAIEAVYRYTRQARPVLSTQPKETALFLAAGSGQRLSVKSINAVVARCAVSAGIGNRVTPHSLRHTCATHLLRGGADIRHVQAILGHASITTTQIYVQVSIEDLATVHRQRHPRRHLRIDGQDRPDSGILSLAVEPGDAGSTL